MHKIHYAAIGVLAMGVMFGGSIIIAGIIVGLLLFLAFSLEFSQLSPRWKIAVLRNRMLIDTVVVGAAIATIGLSTVTSVIGVTVVSLAVTFGLEHQSKKHGLDSKKSTVDIVEAKLKQQNLL